jgi:hypothetical protein
LEPAILLIGVEDRASFNSREKSNGLIVQASCGHFFDGLLMLTGSTR